MSNIITAAFAGETFLTTEKLWKGDYGQVLNIQGLELPEYYEVHFASTKNGTPQVEIGTSAGVNIPNKFLRSTGYIYAWLFLHEGENDGETKYQIKIPVEDKGIPIDQETPEEKTAVQQAIEALNEQTGVATEAASAAEQSAQRAEEVAESIDEGMIARAVSDYLDEHPVTVEESDPTVPEWAKQENKPSYTASEIGALSAEALPDAIDAALAEAKESGLFDGPQGPAGETGPAGPQGPQGETGATGAKGDKGDKGDTGATGPKGDTGDTGSQGPKGDTGNTGPQGPKGDAGEDGEDGISPIVTITAITGGHRVTIADADHPHGQSFDVMDGTGGGGGTSNYNDLTNKPQIAGTTLSGNKSLAELGIAAASAIPTKTSDLTNDSGFGTYSKPSGGIPDTDLSAGVQASLDAADAALPKAGGTMSGAIAMGSNKITGLADGTADSDAVNLGQVSGLISTNTAFYRGSFASKAALLAVAWQTSNPAAANYVTNNDYAVVQDDESQNDECWRYVYVAGTGWQAQYRINETPLTTAQLAALNSGATAENIASIAQKYVKPSGGIPASDLASAVQTSLGKADTALQSAPVTSVNGQTGAVSLSIPSSASDVGAEPAVTEETVSTAGSVTKALDAGKIYHFTGALTALTITLNAAPAGQIAHYHFDFNCGSTAPTVTIPNTVTMPSGAFEASKHYEVDILNNYGAVMAWATS